MDDSVLCIELCVGGCKVQFIHFPQSTISIHKLLPRNIFHASGVCAIKCSVWTVNMIFSTGYHPTGFSYNKYHEFMAIAGKVNPSTVN